MRTNTARISAQYVGKTREQQVAERFNGTQTLRQIQARHAEVARRYAWHARRNRKHPRGSPRLIALVRLSDLEQLYRRRYGAILPYDDLGVGDFALAAHHIAHLGGDTFNKILAWGRAWLPQMPRYQAEALAEEVLAAPKTFKAATLGWRLRLTDQEREELGITTIRAIDPPSPAQRAERRKRRQRERMARHRQSQRDGKPEPLSKAQPWKALGMSRASWYRRKGKPLENQAETRETKTVRSSISLNGAHSFCLTDVPKEGWPKKEESPPSVSNVVILTAVGLGERRSRCAAMGAHPH
jgi:hypothetical protein